ncbi:MAG: cell division protein FtsA [Candidatus Syntrophonatronum acetioxidans]|uniref:Cell division protein FtsA n=1 Tax=Candidatus Syntrophonatronum acetioxidans TaxID=1795816 RepID=A0A424YC80_9FIRM|nr:MAG: cell division protein FtsA [Candidatus Syntrophonatronum acetioxidans]
MAKRDVVISMDIGTSNVRVIVGEVNQDHTINIIGVGTSPSRGLRKGVIVDLDKTVQSITEAVEEAERMVNMEINSVFLGVVGTHITLINNKGVVAVAGEDKEITYEDVERVIQASRVIAMPPDREIIDIIPRQFIVDGYDGIRDPVGMVGVRLEVDAMIITGAITSIRNLMRCVNRADLEIDGVVLNALANGEVSLTDDQKELGVALIDIGGGTTEISVFQQGGLKDLSVLPVGGDYITNDIAVGLRTTIEQAETIKIDYGKALTSLVESEEEIEIKNVGGKEKNTVTENIIASIIEPRVQEIIYLAREELEKMGYLKALPAGVVLTGGVSMMKGVAELTEEVLESSVQVAQPEYVGVKSPVYSTGVGIIHYVLKSHMLPTSKKETKMALPQFFTRIKNWFLEIFD